MKYKTRGEPEPRKRKPIEQPIDDDYYYRFQQIEPDQELYYENISPLDPAYYQNRLLKDPDYSNNDDYGGDFYYEEDYLE
ncbi:hypothetical protein ACFLYC_03485 [Chloroflexota bacterium]